MLRLAWPTVVVLVVQTLVGVAETYFVSFLGTDALAGVALVFPVLMLMQMMSNGGIGGGVSSAVARALGANRHADADALIWHAIVLACAFGVVFTAAAILGGPILYRAMGGTGPTLTAALTYSGVVFAGAIPIWMTALLSSALRGAGNPLIHSGRVDRHGSAEAVAYGADPVRIDLRLAGEPRQGVSRVSDLIHAQDIPAPSAAVAAPAHIEAKRGVTEVAQHSRLDLGVGFILRAHETMQHEKGRKPLIRAIAIGNMKYSGELQTVGLESNMTFHEHFSGFACSRAIVPGPSSTRAVN
jgi:hypothetical protein